MGPGIPLHSKVKLKSNGLLTSAKMLIQTFHILFIPLLPSVWCGCYNEYKIDEGFKHLKKQGSFENGHLLTW